MRMTPVIRTAVVTVVLVAAAPTGGHAQTLTFADVPVSSVGSTALGASYTTQGYTFGCQSADPVNFPECQSLTVLGTTGAEGNGLAEQTLFNNSFVGITTLARVDAGAFDLLSWRIAPLFDDQASTILVEGTRQSGGVVTQSFVLPLGMSGLATFAFTSDFRALSSVRWRGGGFGPEFVGDAEQVAAITVAPSATAVVPEPSTHALFATGLLALGGVIGRRRRHLR